MRVEDLFNRTQKIERTMDSIYQGMVYEISITDAFIMFRFVKQNEIGELTSEDARKKMYFHLPGSGYHKLEIKNNEIKPPERIERIIIQNRNTNNRGNRGYRGNIRGGFRGRRPNYYNNNYYYGSYWNPRRQPRGGYGY